MVVQGISLGSGLRSQNRNISDLYLVSGISTAGDGLGGIFYWNSTSTAADDSLNVFQVTGVSVGRWIRIASSIAVSSPITYNSGVIGITQAGTSSNGYLSSTDWNTFNNKQGAITLTTTGTSGPATLIGNTLNIPEYSSALTGYVPTSRTLTINGVTYDLSANRTWTVTSGVASVDATVPTGFSVSGVPITSTGTIAITFASGYSLPTNAKQTEWDAAYTWVSNFPSQTGNAGKVLSTNGTVLSWIAAGTVTSVDMTVPTGLSISGNPITTAGTLALTYASGYAIPTTVKQSNWDDAYTWVAAFPTQTGQSGKFLTTDGSALSWADNGAGTVTDVSFTTGTTGTDVNSSVATSTTTPAITLNIPVASATNTGKLSSTDWSTFNSKQDVITLTTTGTSGAATFTSNTLNIPQYQGQITLTTVGSSGPSTLVSNTLNIPDYSTALSGYVPITRTLTIDGVTYDLSANRTWAVLPTGGTTGQILAKNSATNYDTVWIDNFTTDVRQYVKAAEAINKGQAVYVSGADGTNILISKASNTTEATSSKTIGLLYQNLALNGHGYVITQGLLSGLDTSAATIGDPVWLGTNGNLIYGLVNKPYAPANLVYLGVVTRVNSNNGEILVSVQNGFELKELHDVVATSPVNGAFIKYNSSNSLWESVAGTTTNVAEGTNLYYTDARARSAISLTTTGNSGASTYSSVTGIINVPEYTLAGLGGVPTTRTLTINGTAYDLSVNRSWSVGTVTSVSFATDTAGNDVAVDGSPVTSAGTITLSIPVASATKTGKLSSSDWTTFNNKQNALTFGNLTETTSSILTITGGTGAVIGSGVTVEVSQASGTQSGYLSSADWTTFNNKQAAITLTTTGNSGAATFITNTLNIPNYTLAGLGGVPTARTLTINGTAYDLSANRTWSVGTVTSVGLSMPSAFTVTNSPVTGSGTLTVTGAGTTTQYVRGDGTLADFPGGTGGGGASVSYYMNGGTNQGTFGGNTYYQMSKTAVTGTAANFTRNTNGYIAEFLTDAGDPALLNIPAGNWDIQAYFSMSAAGNSPSFYVELFKYDGTTFTLIASNSSTPEIITGGTSIDLYYTSLAVPATSLSITDRLAVRFYVTPDSRTATLYTQDNRLCEIVTTFTTGITALNGLTAQVQYLATSTTGTDFTISSSTATHTFNLPVASATNTGKLSNTDWTTFNNKQNALTLGNLTEATSSVLTITGGTNAVVGSGTSIQVKQASGSQSGFLSSTDWTTFNNKLTSPMTTLGDIIYGGASGAATRLGGNITAVKQYLSQTGTGTVSAAPTWATIDGGDIAGYALTKSDDTNVTLTLGGTPATSLLKAVSITVGWSGTLAISRGGTGASSKSAAFDALSPMTTLGDLIYGSVSGSNTRLAGNITTAKQYLSQTGDGTNSAAPVWATITGSDITGAALTKTDDTNVTLTLGGTPATALLRAASITVGWTGTLAATRGGTGIGTYTLGDTLYSSAANTLAKLAGNTTATKKFLTQTGDGTNSAAPSWGTISSSDLPALPNAVTFNNGGTGAASGTTFDGSAARTISYNTIGAQPLLTNPVTGTGTNNYIAKFTSTGSTIGNSGITDDGTTVTLVSRTLSGSTASFSGIVTLTSQVYNSLVLSGTSSATSPMGVYVNHYPSGDAAKYYAQFIGNWASAGTWGIGVRGQGDNTVYIGAITTTSGVIDPTSTFNLQIGNSLAVKESRTLTINGTAYDLSANRTWNVGTVTGTGTTNTIAKWTGSSAIGNSLITDNGTNVTITTTTTNGLVLVTNDVTTLKMKSSVGGTKNWGFATTNLAASDFGIYQSTAGGGDPISAGSAVLYFLTSGAATFSSTVTATAFLGTASYANQLNVYSNNESVLANGFNDAGGVLYINYRGAGANKINQTNFHNGDAAGTYSNVKAASFIKNGGTASQYLMADGSVSTLTNPVTGTGTANKIAKWSGTSTLVDSSISDAAGAALIINKDGASTTGAIVSIYPTTGTNASILNLDSSGAGSFYIGRASSTGGNPLISVSGYDAVMGNTGTQNIRLITNSLIRLSIDGSTGISTHIAGDGNVIQGLFKAKDATGTFDGFYGGIQLGDAGSNQNAKFLFDSNAANTLQIITSYVSGSNIIQFKPGTTLALTLYGSGTAGFSGAVNFPNASMSTTGELNFNSSALNIYTYGRIGLANAGRIIYNNGTGSNLFFGELASNIYGFTPNLRTDTPTLSLDLSNTRVGIGTASPSALLTISGTATSYAAAANIHLYDVSANTSSRNWAIGNAIGGAGYGELGFIVSATQNGNPSGGTTILRLSSTAATFSGNVTTNGTYFVQNTDYNTGTATGTNFRIFLNASSGNTYTRLQTYTDGGSTYGNIALNPLGGNVGIGTTSPSYKLDINPSTYNRIASYFSGTYISGFKFSDLNGSIYYDAAADMLTLGSDYVNGKINFTTAGTERMRITSGGNVQINTTSTALSGKLNIDGDLIFGGTAGASYKITNYQGGSLILGSNNTDVLYITSGGNVGIGTTSPNKQLEISYVSGVNNVAQMRLNSSGGGQNSSIEYSQANSVLWEVGTGMATTSDYEIRDRQNAVNRLTIKQNGNVGIGTTSPSYKLQVEGVVYANGSQSDNVYVGGFFFSPGTYTSFRQSTSQSFNIDVYNGGSYKNALNIAQSGRININNTGLNSGPWFSVYGGVERIAQFIAAGDGTIVIGGSAADGASSGEQYVTYQNATTNTNGWMVGMDDGEDFRWAYGAVGEITDGNTLMRFQQDGSLSLGTLSNGGYKFNVNGSIGATAFYESSDLRIKNIIERNPSVSLDIDLVKYTKKGSSEIRYGYIAQEVQAIIPELVFGEEILSLNYQDIHSIKIAILEKKIKELELQLKQIK